ncbi:MULTISPECIES: PTS beta-glucoside transporter subunit IIBCA [Rothia]|uniref:PTS beta-glucoside transporter subunit IIBCA n=1 Tax=Rothia TaxID=32207 RepID=UPI00066CBFAD|nr:MULTISPECIES: PTS beta-glucoside transporter subunit IIBCA [Rothia]OFM98638.1 PTS beta-glucoside transporter subunit EIIBCA [Rothia sp. HMSC072B03]OHP74363.1 PTS beta-glucoside transporter subunit EIIBCA [Rothia sp. HMSC062F03]
MDHKSVAQRVLKDVGGAGNIVAAAHCATRLRLVLKNQDKVDQAAIDNDEDLKGSFLNAGQFQIIVGPGDVNEVHKHLIAAGAPEASKDDLKSIAAKQGNLVSRFIKTIADIFVPLIPVLVGGGMLMALNSLLTSKGIFGPQAVIELFPEWADFADIVNLLSAAPFAFLPVLVGFSATKVFGGNPYLGLTMGAAMVSPALMNGYNVAASLAGAEGTDPMKYWNLFGLQVQQAGYQGTVLPIMLVAFILSHIEKFFHKVLKGTIDFIFTPTLTILITGFLTFLLVGPPMFQLGTWLGEGINWLYTVAGPLGGLIFGTFYAFIVMTGMHQAFPPIEMSLWATGGSFIFVVASMSNVAQGAAAAGVALTTKNKKIKGIASAAAPSAFLGITEPAMFGVNLALRWPFYIAIVSAGIGSMVTSILGIKAGKLGAAGYLGFPSIEATVGAGIPGFLGCLVLTTVIAFVASFIWGKKVESGNTEEAEAPAVPAATEASTEAPSVASAEASGEGVELGAHLVGTVVPLVDVKDPTFSSGALGAGTAVEPTEGKLYAPADGKITVAFPTGHAYGLRTEDGLDLLMHIGMDTVELDGKHFTPKVAKGDTVKRGDVIAEFDIPAIKAAGYPLATPLVITNSKKLAESVQDAQNSGAAVTNADSVLKVVLKAKANA